MGQKTVMCELCKLLGTDILCEERLGIRIQVFREDNSERFNYPALVRMFRARACWVQSVVGNGFCMLHFKSTAFSDVNRKYTEENKIQWQIVHQHKRQSQEQVGF